MTNREPGRKHIQRINSMKNRLFDQSLENNQNPTDSNVTDRDPSRYFTCLNQQLEQQWKQFVIYVQEGIGRQSMIPIAYNNNCFYASDYVKSFFCGTLPKTVNKKFLNHYKQFDQLSNSFIDSDEILSDLFSQPAFHAHKIFHFQSGKDKHAFVIEKISDGQSTSYRIYQSWDCRFSLLQWLGIGTDLNPINSDSVNRKKQIELYGNGKLLNANELKTFLLSIMQCVMKELKGPPFHVSIYNVNHAGCDLVVINSTYHPPSQFNFKAIADLPFVSDEAYVRYNNHIYYINRNQKILNDISEDDKVCNEFDKFTKADGDIPGIISRTLSDEELERIQTITKHVVRSQFQI